MSKSNGKSPPVKTSLPIASMPGTAGMSNEQLLVILADTINTLRKQAASDIIEISQRLIEAKAIAGHGNWLPWLEKEFGWTDQTARNYMQVYECAKSQNFLNLDLPISALYLLAAPSTPPEAAETVINRAKAGEKVTGGEVKKVVHEAKSKSSPRPPDSGTKKRGGEEIKRHDERMKSARYKLEAFIRDYSDMAEWKDVIEAIKTQLGAKQV